MTDNTSSFKSLYCWLRYSVFIFQSSIFFIHLFEILKFITVLDCFHLCFTYSLQGFLQWNNIWYIWSGYICSCLLRK
jgi:hypothetical protein